MFRWEEVKPSNWLGVEGEYWYRVNIQTDVLEIETNGSVDNFNSLFRLDWDAEAIERQLLDLGPEIAPFLAPLRGLRLMRPSSPSETLISFLCTPNNHIKRIASMVGKLAEFGEKIAEQDGRNVYRFPSLEVVANISETRLRELGFGYRAATLNRAAAELVTRGSDRYLFNLRLNPLREIRQELMSLPGVGKKLADCISLFALDRVEVAPIDTHMWHSLTRLYFPEYSDLAITDRRYEEISTFFQNRFGPLTGWAQQALFFDRVLNWRKP